MRACRGEAAWGGMAVGGGHNIKEDLDPQAPWVTLTARSLSKRGRVSLEA